MNPVTFLRKSLQPITQPPIPTQLPPINSTSSPTDIFTISSLKNLIVSYCDQRLYTSAHFAVNQLFQYNISLAEYYKWHGFVYEKAGNIKLAFRSVEIALILQPDNSELQTLRNRLLPLLPR